MTQAAVFIHAIPDDLAISATEKAACTSIHNSLTRCPRYTIEQVRQRGLRTRLYLRHPISRFASCWAYFTPANNFPGDPVWRNHAYDVLREHPSVEQFTDIVLGGCENEHWAPQLAQHDCAFDEIYQLEQIHETWPKKYPLRHENRARIDKPEITYRLDDLLDYYRDDLTAWQKSEKK